MVEMLCGLLTGLGFGVEPTGRHNDGCFMAVFNVAAFRPLAEFKREVAEFARYLKATPPSEGSPGVFYPGEIEHMREQAATQVTGIDVEDATWEKLRALAARVRLGCRARADVTASSARDEDAMEGEQHDAADGDGRLPAGAELHEPAVLLAPSAVARRRPCRPTTTRRSRRVLEAGKFHMAFFDDRLAMPDRYGNDHAHTVEYGIRGTKMDPLIVLMTMGTVTEQAGPRLHLLDHLLRALRRGPPLRHARPDDRTGARPGTW